jgi:excisionase family DNA binding protein
MDQQWFTPPEAAEYLRVTRSTIYRWTREGRLRAHDLPTGGGRRYRREELDRLLGSSPPDSGSSDTSD